MRIVNKTLLKNFFFRYDADDYFIMCVSVYFTLIKSISKYRDGETTDKKSYFFRKHLDNGVYLCEGHLMSLS
jgi:hypothetical protein